jgi:hypothetical protein
MLRAAYSAPSTFIAELERSAELFGNRVPSSSFAAGAAKGLFSEVSGIRVLDIEGLLLYKKSTFLQIGRFKTCLS